MNKALLTSPCGLDCFNCDAYEGKFVVGKGPVLAEKSY